MQRYQEGLEESIKGNEFIFDSGNLLHYNLQKIVKSEKNRIIYIYIFSRMTKKKATINPKINDDNCLQYALIVALNVLNIEKSTLKEYEKLTLLLINMLGKE